MAQIAAAAFAATGSAKTRLCEAAQDPALVATEARGLPRRCGRSFP